MREEEFESAVKLADAVFRRDGTRRSMREDYPLLFSTANLGNLRAYMVNGKVVSLIGTFFRDIILFGHRIPAVRLAAVCTDPEYRGRGLATSLLADTERFAVREGAALALISGDRGLYKRFGAVDVGLFLKHRLEAEVLAGFTALGIRPVVDDDLPFLAQAYAAKGVRFARRFSDFEALISASMALDRPARIFVYKGSFSRNGAYIVVIREEEGILNCVEYAGDERCVVGMLRSLSENEGGPVVVHTSGADRAMNRLLSKVSAPIVNEFPRVWKVVFPEGLSTSLHDYLAERLSRTEVAAIQEAIGKSDGTELIRMVFGTTKLPIVPAVKGERGVFPVPLPDYGMDFL